MSEAQQVTSEMRVCTYCDMPIHKSVVDDRQNWRHVETGSLFCKKRRGIPTREADPSSPPEAQNRTPEGDTQAMMPFPRPSERDWTEDSSHENGNYQCQCVTCKQSFIGHKRRVQCKLCTSKPVAPDSGKGFAEEANNPPECARCHEEYNLSDFDMEITKYCHNCAHARVAELEAALESSPEGEAKVTWKVQELVPDGSKWWDCGGYWIEKKAREFFGRISGPNRTTRLVKIETRETIVETRKKEA